MQPLTDSRLPPSAESCRELLRIAANPHNGLGDNGLGAMKRAPAAIYVSPDFEPSPRKLSQLSAPLTTSSKKSPRPLNPAQSTANHKTDDRTAAVWHWTFR